TTNCIKTKGYIMRICIIGEANREEMPYIERYITFFTRCELDFDVIYWNKNLIETENKDKTEKKEKKDKTNKTEEKLKQNKTPEALDLISTKPNEFIFNYPLKNGVANKIIADLKFRKFILTKLKASNYDRIVVLTTIPAMLLKDYLEKNYKEKYLFDFRDYTYENFGAYKKAVDKIIENSKITTISSKGYMDFLAYNEKIIMNHNMCFYDNKSDFSDIKTKQVINIGFIGNARYYDENVELIEKLKNTFQYQLWYIGDNKNSSQLEEYTKTNEIKNTSFIGKYANSQKFELYKNIDIVNSISADDEFQSTTSLPTRLYEACLLNKPIIASKGTYLGEIIDQYRIGIVIDVFKDDVSEKLDNYLKNFDNQQFLQGCENFLADVKKDEILFFASLKEFTLQEENLT
ncbi:MAG: glycosyltransferase, partial [Oscillospiraceae bacterium]